MLTQYVSFSSFLSGFALSADALGEADPFASAGAFPSDLPQPLAASAVDSKAAMLSVTVLLRFVVTVYFLPVIMSFRRLCVDLHAVISAKA
jgi:hypothetical protein